MTPVGNQFLWFLQYIEVHHGSFYIDIPFLYAVHLFFAQGRDLANKAYDQTDALLREGAILKGKISTLRK